MTTLTYPRSPGVRLLVAAWITWGLSIASIPLLAFGFHECIKPDPTDDFGMGPFLSGAILGALLAGPLGVTALVLHTKARQIRPLKGNVLQMVEWLVLIAPPAVVLVGAAGLVGAFSVGLPVVIFGLVIIAFVKFRRTRS